MRSTYLFIGVFAALFVLSACGRTPTDSSRDGVVLEVTYAGGFVPTDRLRTVFSVEQNGNASLRTFDANDTVTTAYSRQLSESELDELTTIIGNIGELNETYGEEWRDRVADAGYADIVMGNKRTRVDPNIDEAYPAELQPLRQWIGATLSVFESRQADLAVACDNPRPDACTKEFMPVCGNNNRTYGNKCTACADRNVSSYMQGACNEQDGGTLPAPSGQNDGDRLAFTQCDPSKRPQVCTREYNPVCAEVDNGVRCITTPCPSADRKTYSNACEACADEKVFGYWPGSCENVPSDTPDGDDETTVPVAQAAGKYMICDRNVGEKPADYSQVAQESGHTCVDECPSGYDEYGTQIGALVCIRHLGQAEAQRLARCSTANDCSEGDVCIYVTTGTDNLPLSWPSTQDRNNQPAEALRCAPQEYQNFMLHSGGATVVDERGRVSSMIA